MPLRNKFPVGKNLPHKSVTIVYGSVYFNGNDISAVPREIAFNHPSHAPFRVNQNGFYILFSAQGERKTCSQFSSRNIEKDCGTAVKLQNRLNNGSKIKRAEITVSARRSVRKFQQEQIFTKLTELRDEFKRIHSDCFAYYGTEFIVYKSGSQSSGDRLK